MPHRIPTYRKHPNGLAFVYYRAIQSKDHRQYLGKHGTESSLRLYRQFLKRLEVCQLDDTLPPIQPAPTVQETVLHYDCAAKQHYQRPSGIAKEYGEMQIALRFLVDLYGEELACEIGPKALRVVQRSMAKSDYARTYVNCTISRIKRFFRWASAEEIIPPEHYHKLLCVRGLQYGEFGVRESKKVTSACPLAVHGVLPYLSPVVAAMVRLQYLCGMRPGEVCIVRASDINRSEPIWMYHPQRHKNEWRGYSLVKAIPKAAQVILQPFLDRGDEYLFTPASALAWERQRRMEANPRMTKKYASEAQRLHRDKQLRRRRVKAKQPGEHYTTQSYGKALRRGFPSDVASLCRGACRPS